MFRLSSWKLSFCDRWRIFSHQRVYNTYLFMWNSKTIQFIFVNIYVSPYLKFHTLILIELFSKLLRIETKWKFSDTRVPWTARRSNQSILKEISPGISLEGMVLKLKLQYFGHLMWRVDSLEKTPMLGGIEEEKGATEDEMAGCDHWLDGRESEWTPGVGDGQGGLACWDSWGRKGSDTTEQLNWNELNLILVQG